MIRLGTGRVSLRELRAIAREAPPLELDPACMAKVKESEAAVQARLAEAERELAAAGEFDHRLVNADVREAAEHLLNLITDQSSDESEHHA